MNSKHNLNLIMQIFIQLQVEGVVVYSEIFLLPLLIEILLRYLTGERDLLEVLLRLWVLNLFL